jgi:hypothetical protein
LDICHYFLSPVYTTTFSARQIFGHGKIEFWHGTARLYLISFRAVPKISVRAEHGKVLDCACSVRSNMAAQIDRMVILYYTRKINKNREFGENREIKCKRCKKNHRNMVRKIESHCD